MRVGRREASAVVVVVAVAAAAASAWASLWVAPTALGVDAPTAFSRFQDGSVNGIVAFGVLWALWSAFVVLALLHRIHRSDAWERQGRHRWISLAGCALLGFGGVATASWMLFVEVDLAMEHVMPWHLRDLSAGAPFELLWRAGAAAIIAALLLGAAGALADRRIGPAPRLA